MARNEQQSSSGWKEFGLKVAGWTAVIALGYLGLQWLAAEVVMA